MLPPAQDFAAQALVTLGWLPEHSTQIVDSVHMADGTVLDVAAFESDSNLPTPMHGDCSVHLSMAAAVNSDASSHEESGSNSHSGGSEVSRAQ